jgi:hypothetical protein
MCIQEVASHFSLEPTIMISASIRIFSAPTVVEVTGLSRTTIWRRRHKAQSDASQTRKVASLTPHPDGGFMGMDVVNYVQARRAEAGLPPADEDAILASLVAAEDARIAKSTRDAEGAKMPMRRDG